MGGVGVVKVTADRQLTNIAASHCRVTSVCRRKTEDVTDEQEQHKWSDVFACGFCLEQTSQSFMGWAFIPKLKLTHLELATAWSSSPLYTSQTLGLLAISNAVWPSSFSTPGSAPPANKVRTMSAWSSWKTKENNIAAWEPLPFLLNENNTARDQSTRSKTKSCKQTTTEQASKTLIP